MDGWPPGAEGCHLMPGSTSAPAALDALLAVLQAWPALAAPVDVRDGARVNLPSAAQAVIVGWGGDPGDRLAIEATASQEGLAGGPDREKYTIRCAALAVAGDGSMTEARAAAYALLGACGAAIAASRTLSGTVLSAMIASHALTQDPVLAGGRATVEFGVECTAYTTS